MARAADSRVLETLGQEAFMSLRAGAPDYTLPAFEAAARCLAGLGDAASAV
ncbi:MAG: hypothetical protein PHR21_02070 [Oscillospiraceae bacterium]|nr:hypothetical protein [Oscillospiraceae bacterium]MDD4368219.1 hypothetical protein [Oscillospiraceae bacterium]